MSGFKKWGFTHSGAASLVIADLVAGRDSPWSDLFDPTRGLGGIHGVIETVKGNVEVAGHLLGDRAINLLPISSDDLAPGDGGIVTHDGQKAAAFRDESGVLHACSANCTHMGCQVKWNPAERSWDCPCHGSRFDLDGEVIVGPTTRPLERLAPS